MPVAGDGAGIGRWPDVHVLPDGTPLVLADPGPLLTAVGDDATCDLDDLPVEARIRGSRHLAELTDPSPLRTAIATTLQEHAPQDAGVAVEVAGAVGVDAPALAAVARHVVSFDSDVALVRLGRALLDGRPVPRWVRHEGQRLSQLPPLQLAARDDVTCVVGDALDPPVRAGAADVVVAANIVDSIHDPLTLIGQLDAILAPGGLLVVTSPFAWHDHITPPQLQLGGGLLTPDLDGPEALRRVLEGASSWLQHLQHEVVARSDVVWRVRTSDRTTSEYLVHVLATRKRAPAGS